MTSEPTENILEREHVPKRLVAAREIAAVERDWSAARALQDGEEFAGLDREERIKRLGIHQAFYELVEVQGFKHGETDIILELFAENVDLANATLERIEMHGKWDEADAFERELLGLVFDAGYKGSMSRIARESDEARRNITIPAGFTQEHGYVALRRKRTLLIASQMEGSSAARSRIEVDKVSTFALDIAALTKLSDPAAEEVRLIVASTIYKAIDWQILESGVAASREEFEQQLIEGFDSRTVASQKVRQQDAFESAIQDFYNLAAIMKKYDLTIAQIKHRAYEAEKPAELTDPEGLAFIEAALHTRSNLLTPAATTYYVHS